jgi:hypothetical protein
MQESNISGSQRGVEHAKPPSRPYCKLNDKPPAAPFSCRLMTGMSMRKPYCNARRTPRAGGRQGTKHQRSTKHEHYCTTRRSAEAEALSKATRHKSQKAEQPRLHAAAPKLAPIYGLSTDLGL